MLESSEAVAFRSLQKLESLEALCCLSEAGRSREKLVVALALSIVCFDALQSFAAQGLLRWREVASKNV